MLQLAGHHFFQSSAKVGTGRQQSRHGKAASPMQLQDDQVARVSDLIPRRPDIGNHFQCELNPQWNWLNSEILWNPQWCFIFLLPPPTTPTTRQGTLRVTFSFEYLFLNVSALFTQNDKYTFDHKDHNSEIWGGGVCFCVFVCVCVFVCGCVFLCVCCSCTTLTKQGTSSQDNGLKEKVVWPFVTRGGVGTDVAATEREIRLRLTSQSQSQKTHFYHLKV